MTTASVARGYVPVLAVTILAALAGMFAVLFGDIVQDHPTLFVAPLIPIGALLLLLLDKRKLFYVLMLSRASLDPLLNTTKLSGGVGVGALLNGFMILLGVLFIIEDPRVRTRTMLMVWAPLLAIMGITCIYSPEQGFAFRMLLSTVATAAVFYIGASLVREPEDFRRLIYLVLFSTIGPALYSVVDLARNFGAVGESGFRLMSTFTHPNIFAFYLLLVLVLQLYLLSSTLAKSSSALRILFYVGIAVTLGLVMLTGTRSAWLGVAILFIGYGALFDRRWLVVATLAPLFALLIPGIQDRLIDLFQGNDYVQGVKLNSFAWRKLIWERGIEWMSPLSYLMGNGFYSFIYYSPYFFPLAGDTNPGAHNVYVQLLFETGLFGVIAFLFQMIFLTYSFYSARGVDSRGLAVLTFLVLVYMTIAFSDNLLGYLAYNWYFWLVCGAGLFYSRIARDADEPR